MICEKVDFVGVRMVLLVFPTHVGPYSHLPKTLGSYIKLYLLSIVDQVNYHHVSESMLEYFYFLKLFSNFCLTQYSESDPKNPFKNRNLRTGALYKTRPRNSECLD